MTVADELIKIITRERWELEDRIIMEGIMNEEYPYVNKHLKSTELASGEY